MSGITYIKRITGSTNNIVYLETADTTATATGSAYITNQATNIDNINEGAFTWETNDCIMLSASDGISWCSINSTFTTLTAFSGFGVNAVTYTGTLTNGDIPKFDGIAGVIEDSGIAASNVMSLAATNQMASGADIALDKGTGTVSAGAVTINHQAGVITTTSLSTAGGGSATVTLTNSFISASSVINLQWMGGSNTVPNFTMSAVPSSGSATITIYNNTAATALNGTIIIGFNVF